METHEVTEEDFRIALEKSPLPLLVDFWAPWCAPCKSLAPMLSAIAKEMDGSIYVVKVNVDDIPELAFEYGVTSLPTLIVLKNGAEVKRHIGILPMPKLREFLKPL